MTPLRQALRRPADAVARRFDVVPGRHRPHHLRTGAIALALLALAVLGAAMRDIPLVGGGGETVVRAEFAAANQVRPRTPVRVAGVDVGQVEAVDPGASSHTSVVTMRIDEDVAIHRDARADIRWRTLLGGSMYIDLQPGSRTAAALGANVIRRSRTSSQVEFDHLLQLYDGNTADAQRRVLKGLRQGLGDPEATARVIRTAGPTLRTVGRGLAPLRGRVSDDLRRMVAASAATVDGLGRNVTALQNLVTGANGTFAVTDASRRELGEMIELSPRSLDSTLVTMRRLRTTLEHLDPLVARLRPGARELAPALRETSPALTRAEALMRHARPLLRAAGPTFDSLRGASRAGAPLMSGLDPTLRRLNDELLPFLALRDGETRLRTYESIGPFISTLNSAAAEFNDEGYVLHFPAPMGPNSLMPASGALARACVQSVERDARGRCPALGRAMVELLGGGTR